MDVNDINTILIEILFIAFLVYLSPLLGLMIGGILLFAHVCPEFAYDHEGE